LDRVSRFLRRRKFTVLYSGGKDSTATLLWVYDHIGRSRNWNVLYVIVTGNTDWRCTEYVIDVCNRLGIEDRLIIAKRTDIDFFDCVLKWGMPIISKSRWCLHQFKLPLMRKLARPVMVLGTKKSDSDVRGSVKSIDVSRHLKNITVQPILEWTTPQVLDYIREHGIPINPCYDIFGHSGNCMLCPFASVDSIKRTMSDTYWGEKIARVLREMKGTISREYARKWLKYSGSRITEYLG